MKKTSLLPTLHRTLRFTGESVAFYFQAVLGHFKLLMQRRSIDRLLAGASLAPKLKRQLEAVQRIRNFARNELGLPAKRQYNRYVELGRLYPVWSVTAAPELSLRPLTWHYWFVGRQSYRGFFDEGKARKFADELEQKGWEVYLSGIPAYSTLGWFSDPVLSSFVHQPEGDLAELIFHELTHQVLFVPGDTVFNESLAVMVADEGLRRYSVIYPQDIGRIELARTRRNDFVRLVLSFRQELHQLYAMILPDEIKRERKAVIMADLREAYTRQKEQWGGYSGYDAWFAAANNARLNAVGTYHDLVPALRALLQSVGGDLPLFFEQCRQLAKLTQSARHESLQSLLENPTSS